MDYPHEFKRAVLEAYPNEPDLEKKLQEGDEKLGDLLEEHGHEGFSPEDIIAALEAGQADELLKAAIKVKEQRDIYAKWCEIYLDQKEWS